MSRNAFILILFLCLVQPLFAQEQRISLNVHEQTFATIFKEIEKQSGYTFSYSSDFIDVNKKVDFVINNANLQTTLNKLFKNTPINVEIKQQNIILTKRIQKQLTISGYVREKGTGELLIGAIVSANPLRAGSVTNQYGFYSITLPIDTYSLAFSYPGYQTVVTKSIAANSDINIELEINALKEVVITDENEGKKIVLNKVEVPLNEINGIPMVLGEKDVVKYVMLSPGIQKGNEGNAYMFVRGGGPDQNLILIDDAIIYNAYHFLGLSSLFSGNELRRAELIKGGFSSKYGGRLSSVLDMSMRDGNRERFGVDYTIGAISSRILVEGPLIKNKASFLVSARKSYIDKMASLFATNAESVLNYGYYDIHAKMSCEINNRHKIMVSGYFGQDGMANSTTQGLSMENDGIIWGNRALSFRWNHQITSHLFANTSLVSSYYKSRIAFGDINTSTNSGSSSGVQSEINDYTVKYDLEYDAFLKHQFKTGIGLTNHTFTSTTSLTNFSPDSVMAVSSKTPSYEGYSYLDWIYTPTVKWELRSGLRYAYYRNQVSYNRLEPRVSILYKTHTNWQWNLSYALMNQFVHMISAFNGFGLPSDVWISSDAQLKPQKSHLITLGTAKNNWLDRGISFSMEGYYKKIENAVLLKEGASFFQILPMPFLGAQVNTWNELATQGNATSYGIEWLVRKSNAHWETQLSYTLSKTTMQFNQLNLGRTFDATFDRRHDIGCYIKYKLGNKFQFSMNWSYGTGNAITLPSGEYFTIINDPGGGNSMVPSSYYDKKNGYRMQAYHRLDLSIMYFKKLTPKMLSTLEFSIYNMYNRANPFFYQIEFENTQTSSGVRKLQKVSLFPIMPALSWSIKI